MATRAVKTQRVLRCGSRCEPGSRVHVPVVHYLTAVCVILFVRRGAFSAPGSSKSAPKVLTTQIGRPSVAGSVESCSKKRGRAVDNDHGQATDETATRSSGREKRPTEIYRPSKATKASGGKAKNSSSAARHAREARTEVRADGKDLVDAAGEQPQGRRCEAQGPAAAADTSSEAEKIVVAQDAPATVPLRAGLPLSTILANLHGGGAGGIVGREDERRVIARFLDTTAGKKQAGALYISGRPGCGKTLAVRAATDTWRRKCKVVAVNGMSLVEGTRDLFGELLRMLCPAALKEKMDAELCLRKLFTAGGCSRPMILVVDELDALLESGCEQSVLATLFSWTQLPGSKLVLIGIANALDLTHRFLPILRAKNCAPQLLTFTPYNEDGLLSILRQRLDPSLVQAPNKPLPSCTDSDASAPAPASPSSQDAVLAIPGADPEIKFDLAALDLCARRVAAESGDTRKAMEACREAAKAVVRAASASAAMRAASGSSEAGPELGGVLGVGMAVMAKTLSTLLVNNHKVADARLKDLPLQQALLLCTIVLGVRAGHNAHSESDLLSSYQRICHKHRLPPLAANQLGEIRGALCDIGVLKACAVGKGKKAYLLNVKDDVVQNSLEGIPVYGKILADGMRCSALSLC